MNGTVGQWRGARLFPKTPRLRTQDGGVGRFIEPNTEEVEFTMFWKSTEDVATRGRGKKEHEFCRKLNLLEKRPSGSRGTAGEH